MELKFFCFNAHLIEGAFIEVVYGLYKETAEERTNESNVNQIVIAFMEATKP